MATRQIKTLQDAHKGINDLFDYSQHLETSDWNRKGQRIRNNAPGVDGKDYVILDQLKGVADNIKRVEQQAVQDLFIGITFGIGVGAPVIVANHVTPPYVVWSENILIPLEAYILANVPNVGSDLLIDIILNETDSIFGSTKLTLPNGTSPRVPVVLNNIWSSPKKSFKKKDVLSPNVTQVGSTFSGQDIQVVIKCQLA